MQAVRFPTSIVRSQRELHVPLCMMKEKKRNAKVEHAKTLSTELCKMRARAALAASGIIYVTKADAATRLFCFPGQREAPI